MTTKTATKEWSEIPFADCLQRVTVGREKQIKEKDYSKTGKYPIVDQGQFFIAGYTNDKSRVISDIQPFIIFGDHTRVLKYIDFPIVLGADGTKVIKPNSDFDTRFFYYSLKHIDVPSRGYNRHYTLLKEKSIARPPLTEQKAIAHTLTTVQDAITKQENLINKLKELKRSMMQHLFTHGTKGEKTKMTEIGEVPESWNEVEIGSLGQIVTGSTPSTKIDRYYSPQEIDFVSPGDISYGKYIYSTEKQISKAGFEVSRPIPKDAICCVCIGSSIGKVAKAYRESTSNQQVNSIICNENFDSDFVYYLMSFYSDMWRGYATFGPLPLLSKGSFSKITIPVSIDTTEQKKIAKMLATIEEKIEVIETKHSMYQNFFKTLLHELMSGERRIKYE